LARLLKAGDEHELRIALGTIREKRREMYP
jgi:hypothetical protein